MNNIAPVIMIVLGLLLCLFGYRLKRIAFAVFWFIIGFNLATAVLPLVAPYFSNLDPIFLQILPFACGLLLSLLGASAEKVILFLLCVIFAIQHYLTLTASGTLAFNFPGIIISAVIGVGLGVATVMLVRPAIILLTALAGAHSASANLLLLIPQIPPAYGIVIFLVLAALGAVYQFKSTKHLA